MEFIITNISYYEQHYKIDRQIIKMFKQLKKFLKIKIIDR